MNDKLHSYYLNRLVNSVIQKDDSMVEDLKTELLLSTGMQSFGYRDDRGRITDLMDHLNDVVIPAMEEMLDDFSGDENKFLFMGTNGIRILNDNDLNFDTPVRIDRTEEVDFLKKLLSYDADTLRSITDAGTDISVYRDALKMQLYIKRNGYYGKYPAINNLLKGTVMYDKNHKPVITSGEGYDSLWSYIEANTFIGIWVDKKKIYRISDALEEDFINQEDLAIPTDALRFLPFKSFAIDLSENAVLGKWFDCAIATVAEYNGCYKVDFKVFDKAGLLANSGFKINFLFMDGEDTKIDPEELKIFTHDTISRYDFFKERCHKAFENVRPFSNDIISLENYIVSQNFSRFQSVRPSMYRKLEKFLFASVFYLCCSNKSVRKVAADTVAVDKMKVPGAGKQDVQKTVVPVEVEQLGFDIPQFTFNEVDLDDDGIRKVKGNGRTGRTTRPHLVRGHYHHYRCGKGRKELIYKYTNPYYTGVKHDNIVSVTTLV